MRAHGWNLTASDRRVVQKAARCMADVSAMQHRRRGNRNGEPYVGITADDVISAYTDDWRRQVQLLSATIEYAVGRGLFTPYGGGRQWRRSRGA